jgi:hypothetical protein
MIDEVCFAPDCGSDGSSTDVRRSLQEGEELSWKLVQRDVFRPPSRLVFLSALVGSGNQIISALTLVLGLGVVGAHYHES